MKKFTTTVNKLDLWTEITLRMKELIEKAPAYGCISLRIIKRDNELKYWELEQKETHVLS
jgi:hypothetical protein